MTKRTRAIVGFALGLLLNTVVILVVVDEALLLVPAPWVVVVLPLALWVVGYVAHRAWAQLDGSEDEDDGGVVPAAVWFCPWRWAPWLRDFLRRL
jgi:hypothetical protein